MSQLPTFDRHRRLRSSEAMRSLIRETDVTVNDLLYPMYIIEGENVKNEVVSMPGIYQISLDLLADEIKEIKTLGIQAIMLFGVITDKDETGTGAYSESGIIQEATRLIKQEVPEMLVIADTCLSEYTSHGHCGVIGHGEVAHDAALKLLAQTAVSQAKAVAYIIAPSNMMDGFVITIRNALDDAGFSNIPIMSYAIKYSSALYAPFGDAAGSTPEFGDRKQYELAAGYRMEALGGADSEVNEGGDFLIVKPALSYLYTIRHVAKNFNLP